MKNNISGCNQYKHHCRKLKVSCLGENAGFIKIPDIAPIRRIKAIIQRPVNGLDSWYDNKFKPWLEKWVRRAVIAGMFIFALYFVYLTGTQAGKQTIIYEGEAQVINTMPQSIAELKARTINKLAEQCETKGIEEPDAAIILDSNNKMSIGRYMWQIESVQHYAKLLYNQELSRKEAILIALDEGKINLGELTTKVMFDIQEGYEEWHTCSELLELDKEVEIINSL